ncbi:hypothetical protein AVEN_97652-1 [Araneus ventricosus]|uniref:Uncharacterized protein n=1 Tax=Araneus ventricosus TaxID=182803 RepID=A0A4Y2GXD1_ARAVE|nr:hypothetical protein AVEN_97652-1 [Araneus ventricosus]
MALLTYSLPAYYLISCPFSKTLLKTLKSKTQSADSNLRPRCEGSGKTKDLPTLAPSVETRKETQNPPCRGRGVWVARILRLGILSQMYDNGLMQI